MKFKPQEVLCCRWKSAEQGAYMLNTDGSVQQNGTGYGGTIRDGLGNVVHAYAGCSTRNSVIHQEIEAIVVGLKQAQEMGIENLEVNSDSLGAINILKGSERCPWHQYTHNKQLPISTTNHLHVQLATNCHPHNTTFTSTDITTTTHLQAPISTSTNTMITTNNGNNNHRLLHHDREHRQHLPSAASQQLEPTAVTTEHLQLSAPKQHHHRQLLTLQLQQPPKQHLLRHQQPSASYHAVNHPKSAPNSAITRTDLKPPATQRRPPSLHHRPCTTRHHCLNPASPISTFLKQHDRHH
ncbi:hypothetical protein IFM89_039386 [Coptis chinensis]|uniref:RNase H type-1 domain-containing protein n=1 Tax=Coptis chinensis TaxID=261450 RepID=A0A835HFD1_9MAGN|nr:hypothetical protein IFM89_039386 [Coptis chinensis]